MKRSIEKEEIRRTETVREAMLLRGVRGLVLQGGFSAEAFWEFQQASFPEGV